MAATIHLALQAFVNQIEREFVLAQVLIRRMEKGFELRHVADGHSWVKNLRKIQLPEARDLAQATAAGAFRPLKSAPNLQSGWWLSVDEDSELEAALNQFYPGAIADWHAARSTQPPLTHFREFTNRQTGMYRITHRLTDAQAAPTIRAACHARFCLKQRLWTVPGLAPDSLGDKSAIPCLEPCAVLLEFARVAMRIEQEDQVRLELAPSEAATLYAALQMGLRHSDPEVREGDTAAPGNPRRVQLLLEKFPATLKPMNATE